MVTAMRSVADDLRREDRERARLMIVAERVREAFELGDRDLAAFAAFQGLSLPEARRRLDRQRQVGRRLSRCMRDRLGRASSWRLGGAMLTTRSEASCASREPVTGPPS
jgi:hypothetical protein